MALPIGTNLENRYEIQALLGEGGFGAVYRARDTRLDAVVAVKENFMLSPESQRQFEKEAKILAGLHHAHLPRVMDHFVIPNKGQYLVMDFVEGISLSQLLGQQVGRPLPEGQVVGWISQICDALAYLHRQTPPIIHRDIKPANIIINRDGQVMLVDFGIAKQFDPNLSTSTGARGLTPGFAPPEQYGKARTDARTDVYALGATLYTMLTGQPPPDAIERLVHQVPTPLPRQFNPTVSPMVEQAIMKAIEPTTTNRFQSIEALRQALVSPLNQGGVQGQPVGAAARPVQVERPASAPRPASVPRPQPTQSNWLFWGGVGVIAVFVLFFIYPSFNNSRVATPAPRSTPAGSVANVPATWTATSTPVPALTWTPTPEPPTDTPVPEATWTDTPTPPPAPTWTPKPKPTATPEPQAPAPDMVLVSAGEFTMGASADVGFEACKKLYIGHESDCKREWYTPEEPAHKVTLDAFYIDKYEVTNGKYAECVKAGKCTEPGEKKSFTRNSYYGNAEYNDYPVIYVDWTQAKTYCEWRGGRLPTEAEWEKAARGTDGRTYPWGNEFDGTKVNFCDKNCTYDWANKNYDDGYADTAPVGNYPSGASPYGAMDMAGNVWEWVSSEYKPYPYKADDGREDLTNVKNVKVLRGGSWGYNGDNVRAMNRYRYGTDIRDYDIGFRCVVRR